MRKALIKLASRIESRWQETDLSNKAPNLSEGWYISEFLLDGAPQYTPTLIIENAGKELHCEYTGAHAGRNRMMSYLPQGKLTAYSEMIQFKRLSKIPNLEARARILLICVRYLRDFFNPIVLFKMIALQFKPAQQISQNLMEFYSVDADAEAYLKTIRWWAKHPKLAALWLRFSQNVKVAVLLEDPEQQHELKKQIIGPDQILTANEQLNSDIDFVLPLSKAESLRPASLFLIKRALSKSWKKNGVKPTLLYSDHDYRFDEEKGDQAMEPVFKPQPSEVYLHCYAYLGPSVVFSSSTVDKANLVALFDSEYQYYAALELFTNKQNIVHLDETIMVSDQQQALITPKPNKTGSPWPELLWQREENHNSLKVNPEWNDCPSVDLIIPTRDGLSVLKPCVDSILAKTDYPNYQIIIVDNGSEKKETHDYFRQVSTLPNVHVIAYPGEFNYSAINNFAAKHGHADYIGLINNDIEVIEGDWLKQMMAWAVQPSVGIVGAKLLFGDGRVQHAGVTIGMGNAAGHIHRLEAGDSPGYQYRCLATQNMMAVTAACLVTPRDLFEQLGGLDEGIFKVAYNDIDYCLRVEQLGKEVVWTPEAVLYHHESVSRGDDMSEQHINRYFKELKALQAKWKTKGFVDKYYSRHLRISDEGVYPKIARFGTGKLRYLG